MRGTVAWRVLGIVAVALALAGAANAQAPTITNIATVPAGLSITNQPQVQATFTLTGFVAPVTVQFQRDDGALDTVQGLQNGNNSITLVLSDLPTTSDGRLTTFAVVAQDSQTPTPNVIVRNSAVSFRYDIVAPNVPTTTSPSFPATVFTSSVQIIGSVTTVGGAALTTGTVFVSRTAPFPAGFPIGAGAVLASPAGRFTATVDLAGLPLNTPTNLFIVAEDGAGNVSASLTVSVTRRQSPPPTFSVAPTCQPSGGLVRNPGVLIRGAVAGQLPPYTVNFIVDGTLSSQVTGLADDQAFAHTLALPGDGPHNVQVEAFNSDTPPRRTGIVGACNFTLDTQAPGPNLLIRPDPALGTVITSGTPLIIEGVSTERAFCTTSPSCPRPVVLLSGPVGVTFTPASPLLVADFTQRFNTTATFPTTLADGVYTIALTSVDAAGNTSPGASSQILVMLDRTAPTIAEVRIDDVLAPQTNPPVFVGRDQAIIRVVTSEDMATPPVLTVTSAAGVDQAVPVSGGGGRVFTYDFTARAGRDGPYTATFSRGRDRAGNPIDQVIERLFVVDTAPPTVVSISPLDLTTSNRFPTVIRVVFQDPPDSAGLASGLDLLASQILVAPPGAASTTPVTGTQVPFDPRTLDLVIGSTPNRDGIYRITVRGVDKVGNRAGDFTSSFNLDTTPILLRAGLIECTPRDRSFVNPQTFPRVDGRQGVTVRVNDPQFDPVRSLLELDDFCRAPPKVPGRKIVNDDGSMSYVLDRDLATDGTEDGTYAKAITIVDSAGNSSPQTFATFIYDSQIPIVESTFPADGGFVNGPLRAVDGTMTDPTVDTCRARSGIDRSASVMRLFLTAPNANVNLTQPRQITGTLRFITAPNETVDRVLLEIVDRNGVAVGLRTQGLDDGTYRVEVEAADRAANRSILTSATFVYDTLLPDLTVDRLRNGDTLSGRQVKVTGTVRDNAGGSGIDRVVGNLVSVGPNGVPTTSVPQISNVTATLNPLPEPNSGSPPRRTFSFEAPLLGISEPFRGRFTLAAIDRAGNTRTEGFDVQVVPGTLQAPLLSQPSDGACTDSNFVNFEWSGVSGAADYQIRIRTPKGNEIVRQTAGPVTSLRLNLGLSSDGDGAYFWNVTAIDGGQSLGTPSRSRVFSMDTTPPRVLAIDAQDPTPGSRGVLTPGETRFTLTFSEDLDPRTPLSVSLQPDSRSVAPIPVTTISLDKNIWVGRAILPSTATGGPDVNGLAELRVSGAKDCAGNVMDPPNTGLVVFEIATGPLLKIAFFQNPIDPKDLIVVLKAFKRENGPSARVIDLPVATFERAGERTQSPALQRINESTFQGLYRLNTGSTVPITLRASARDDDGNTALRVFTLNVVNLGGGVTSVVSPSSAMVLSVKGEASSAPVAVVGVPRALSLASGQSATTPDAAELTLVATLDQFEPAGARLPPGSTMTVDLSRLDGLRRPDLLGKAGLFEKTASGWRMPPQRLVGGKIEATMSALAPLALMFDSRPPTIELVHPAEGETLTGDDEILDARVVDAGSGLEPSTLTLVVGDKAIPAKVDAEGRVTASLAGLSAGRHQVALAVADRAGNVARSSRALVAPGPAQITELVPFPNPARLASHIRYRLTAAVERVTLSIHDVSGRRVRVMDGPTSAGTQTVEWSLDRDDGGPVSSGVYLLRAVATAPGRRMVRTSKIAVIR